MSNSLERIIEEGTKGDNTSVKLKDIKELG